MRKCPTSTSLAVRFAASVAALATAAGPARAGRFTPPADDADARAQVQSLRAEISSKSLHDAAARFDELAQDHAAELVAIEDGELISVGTCLDALDDIDKAALTPEYRRMYDGAAHQMLQAVSLAGSSKPQDFYAVARRYPLSSAAVAALTAGGDRAAVEGYWPTAQTMYALAQAAGWTPDDAHARRLEALKRATSSEPSADRPAPEYTGPIPFDAAWYGRPDASDVSKFFPYAAGGAVFVAGRTGVIAFKADAELLWTYPNADSPRPDLAPQQVQRLNRPLDTAQGRWREDDVIGGGAAGPVHTPAALAGAGAAQILLARLHRTEGTGYGFQAIRGSDAKPLWNTDATDALARLNFLPAPAVCGRYVYALATDGAAQGQPAALVLAALDVVSGRELWRTTLGTLPAGTATREGQPSATPEFTEPAGLVVEGDQVLLSPNIGFVAAVGRFDGKIRWLHPYATTDTSAGASVDPTAGRQASPRFDNKPQAAGRTLVVAPQDAVAAFGLDVKTGEARWQAADLAGQTLVGAAAAVAVFEGQQVTAIDADTGRPKWTYAPTPEQISGPAVVTGATVFVPTSGPFAVPLAVLDGSSASPPVLPPNFRKIISGETGKSQLSQEARISFGLPIRRTPG